jgi:DNA-binding NarL/FixJ family response regulator
VKLLVCDDHALFREGLGYVLRELDGEARVLEAVDAEAAFELVAAHEDLDLVLLDLGLPGLGGLDALRRLRSLHPGVPVAIVSAHDRADMVRKALDAGACGFIPKSSSGALLRSALQVIFAGGVYIPATLRDGEAHAAAGPAAAAHLTPRQREVLALVGRGLTNREIAGVLGLSEGTVKNHVAAILERLEISNRTEAAYVLRDLGLDEESGPA